MFYLALVCAILNSVMFHITGHPPSLVIGFVCWGAAAANLFSEWLNEQGEEE